MSDSEFDPETNVVLSLFADPASFREVGSLFAEHFYCPALGAIAEAILGRCRVNLPVSAFDLVGELQPGILDEVGGSAFLLQLELQGHPGISLAAAADGVRAGTRLRRLISGQL